MSPKGIINALIRSYRSGSLHKPRVRGVLIFSVSLYIVLMIAMGFAWYSNQWATTGFHFFNDWPEWKQLDKFAHFFWTFQTSSLASRLLSWAGLDQRKSSVGGAIMGLMFVSCVEIPDGFSEDYGASIFDVMANTLGCAAFLAQSLIWNKILIWPKYSFHQTMFAPLRPGLLGDGFLEEVLKDYNGQTFWYSLQLPRLRLPGWLTIAVGVSVDGMVYGRDAENLAAHFNPMRKYFLSVDLNLSHFKTSSKALNSFFYIFNIIKFPAPAIEFSAAGIRFHPLYF